MIIVKDPDRSLSEALAPVSNPADVLAALGIPNEKTKIQGSFRVVRESKDSSRVDLANLASAGVAGNSLAFTGPSGSITIPLWQMTRWGSGSHPLMTITLRSGDTVYIDKLG